MKRTIACCVSVLLVVLPLMTVPSGARAAVIETPVLAARDGGVESFEMYNMESSGGGSSFSSWLNFGTAHKVLGYSALASGITAMATGMAIANDYDSGRTPSSFRTSLHSGSSGAAAGLAVAACATGLLAYGGVFDFNSGVNTYNTHIVLALLATIGFIASLVTAPEAEDGGALAEGDYINHCRVAQVSGATMFASIIVIQF